MARPYGWGPKGHRVIDAVPHGHWEATTFLCGLRLTGLVAPVVIGGAPTGPDFLAYPRQVLLPVRSPGDVVVTDNLPPHKLAGVAAVRAGGGARPLYLPPYSPDLNPIERAFARVKARLRRERLRTTDALWDAFGRSLDGVPPSHAENDSRNAGYSPG